MTSLITFCLVGVLLLSACSSTQSRPSSEAIVSPEVSIDTLSTPMPTYTPTLPPVGSNENPYRMGIVDSMVTETQRSDADRLASQLSANMGVIFTVIFFADFLQLEEALQKGFVQFAWLQPVEYILAAQKQLLTSVLVTNHLGVTAYGVQFLGNVDSNFTSYFDSGTHTSTTSAVQALQQFSGLRPCYSSERSLSGYWVPNGLLAQNAINTKEPVFTYSSSASIRALYIKGVCDFSATYAYLADPRTSSEIITDLSDVLSKVPIIWTSGKIIPNLSLSAVPTLDLAFRNRVAEQLIQTVRTDEGKQMFSSLLDYDVVGMDGILDGTYDDLRGLLRSQGVNLYSLIGQ
ncbi:MAG: PhnD/SsuA/transferrin family substrate-binding protein [Anaerolineaceae bacterium]